MKTIIAILIAACAYAQQVFPPNPKTATGWTDNGTTVSTTRNVSVGSTVVPAKTLVVGQTAPQVPGLDDVAQWDCHARNGTSGTQWGCGFFRMFTDSGQSTIGGELDGVLSGLWHYFPFTIPTWKAIEVGGGVVDGAGAVVTNWFGVDANLPTVTNSGSVVNAAPIHINGTGVATGIINPYAIWSESINDSLFLGAVRINHVGSDPASNAASGSVRLSDSTNTSKILDMGIIPASGAYLQGRVPSGATTIPLLLNPAGGTVQSGGSLGVGVVATADLTVGGSNALGEMLAYSSATYTEAISERASIIGLSTATGFGSNIATFKNNQTGNGNANVQLNIFPQAANVMGVQARAWSNAAVATLTLNPSGGDVLIPPIKSTDTSDAFVCIDNNGKLKVKTTACR